MSGEHRERRKGERLERVDRLRERMRHEPLGALLELLVGDLADVVAGREHPVRARHEHAARLRGGVGQLGERRGDRVEDRVVERVALGRVGDRQAHHARGGLIEEQLAVGELA